MNMIKELSNKTIDKILPIVFFSNGIISCIMLLFASGFFMEHEYIRIAISGLFSIAIWVVLLANILFNIKCYERKEIIIVLIIVLITALPFFVSFINYNIDRDILLSFGRYGIFSLSYVFAAIILNKNKKFAQFISYFKWYGIILIPFVLFYVLRMFQAPTEANEFINIGGFSYMSIANTLSPIMIGCMADLLINKENKKYRIISWVIIILFWAGIIYSGTRGTIISICWVTILLVPMFIRRKNKEQNLIIIKEIVLVVIVFVFSVYCWAPMSSAFGDSGRLSESTIKAEFSRVENIDVDNIFLNEIIKNDEQAQKTIKRVKEEIITGKLYSEEVKNGKIQIDDVKEYKFITGRVTLYKCAIGEFLNNPILGNGVFYFEKKYGTYPHNWLLELLCDLGIIITTIICFFIIILLIKLFKVINGNIHIMGIILLCFSYVPKYMLSGSIYLNGTLMFSITFAMLYIYNQNKNKLKVKTIQKG